MPNGFHGPQERWLTLEAPLIRLDPELERFARAHKLSLRRNDHNWPSRSLQWGAPIERVIQIYLAAEQPATWNLWICASEDRAGSRYWKHAFLRRAVPSQEIESNLHSLLDEALTETTRWGSEQLEFATRFS